MNCVYLLTLTLASVMCFIAYFYKPWDKPKIIFIILIALSAFCVLMACVELFFAQRMIRKFNDQLLRDPHVYGYSGVMDFRTIRFAYYFAICNVGIGILNLGGSIIGLLVKNRTIYLVMAILFILEMLAIIMGIFITVAPMIR